MENIVIKREPSPSTPPEDRSDIKAKLNLHVKRRLQDQDYGNSQEDNDQLQNTNKIQETGEHKLSKDRHKEIRQKRPYHKRTDKKLQASSQLDTTTPQRKYKGKFKQQSNSDIDILTNNFQDDSSMHATALNTGGGISAGDEDEGGGQDELRPGGREKEKCPDVLAMVLSMKKRTLMQDPEVQKFLSDVMKVIKS